MPAKRPSPHTEPSVQTPRKIANRQGEVQLPAIAADPLVWSDALTTCLSLGLDPSKANQRPVTCNGCITFFEKKLKYNISNNNPNLTRSRRQLCERPFDCPDDAETGKLHARDRLKRLFARTVAAAVSWKPRRVVSPPPPIRWQKSQVGPKPLFAANGSISAETTKKFKASLGVAIN